MWEFTVGVRSTTYTQIFLFVLRVVANQPIQLARYEDVLVVIGTPYKSSLTLPTMSVTLIPPI